MRIVVLVRDRSCVYVWANCLISFLSTSPKFRKFFLLPFLLSFSCVLPDILSRTQQVTSKMRQLQWTCFSFSLFSFTFNFVLLSLTRLHMFCSDCLRIMSQVGFMFLVVNAREGKKTNFFKLENYFKKFSEFSQKIFTRLNLSWEIRD